MPSSACRSLHQLQDLRLDGDVERGGRLVGDQQRRPADQRHGDHRPLAQPARQLEGIALRAPAPDRGSRPAAASRVSLRVAVRAGSRCGAACSASPTWSPIVWSGDSEVIGSWKMIEMRPPRIARIRGPSRGSLAMSIGLAGVFADRRTGSRRRVISPTIGRMPMMAWLITDLPDPDSPTSATVPPCGTRNETPRTASSRPPAMLKEILRFSYLQQIAHRRRSVCRPAPATWPMAARLARVTSSMSSRWSRAARAARATISSKPSILEFDADALAGEIEPERHPAAGFVAAQRVVA